MYSVADMETFGKYHQVDTAPDVLAQALETEKQVVHDRIFCSPHALLSLMLAKVQNLWGSPGLGFSLGFVNRAGVTWHGLVGVHVYEYAIHLDRVVFFFAVCFALLGAGSGLRRKENPVDFCAVFPFMTLMAFFCVFLLIEVQPRYAYLPQIFLYIAAAAGISVLMRKKQASA